MNAAVGGCRRRLERQHHDPHHGDQRADDDHREGARPAEALTWGVPHAVFSRRSGAGAEALDEHERDDAHEHEQQHRNRRPQTEVEAGEQGVVVEHRDRLGAVGALVEDVDRVEDPERVERAEQQRDEDRRLHQRQRDPREPLPGAGAVHLRRVEQFIGHERQAGQQQQRHERRVLPDLGDDDRHVGAERVTERVSAHAQQVRDPAAVVQRPRVVPRVRGDHGHDPVRDQGDRAQRAAGEDHAVHGDRQQHAEHELDRDADHRDDHRVQHVLPPDRCAQHSPVVVQADPGARGGKPQVGPLQRQDDGVDQRVGGDREHDDQCRSDQCVGEAALGLGAIGQMPSSWLGAGGGGRRDGSAAHSSAFDESACLTSLRKVLTIVVGSMADVGDNASWMAKVMSA